MKLILHQAMTDLRAQRWLVAAWAAMLLGACAIEALRVEDAVVFPLLALALGRVVLGWLLAIRFVHADPLDGTTAFWLTRPLSPRTLLAAKSILVGGLLLGVPGVAALTVFAANGFGLSVVPGVLAGWLLIEVLLLLPIVLVATLTRDVARLVLTLLVGAAAWWVVQGACWKSSMLPAGYGRLSAWQSRVDQAWLVIGAGVVVVCAILVARQYLTRRTGGVAFAGLVAALGIATIAALWPIQLMTNYRPAWDEPGIEPVNQAWSGAGRVSVALDPGSLRLLAQPGRLDTLVGALRVDGLDDDVIVRTVGGRGTLRFSSDGEIVEQRPPYAVGFGLGLARVEDEASRRNFERLLGARIVDAFPETASGLRLVAFKPGFLAGREGAPATYDATLLFDAYRIRAAAVVPVRAGASARVGDVVTTVLGSRKVARLSRWVVEVRQTVPRALSSGDDRLVTRYIRHRKRGEVMVLSGSSGGAVLRGLNATAVMAAWFDFVPNYGETTQGVPIDDAWLADAEIVLVTFERLGRFTRPVTLPQFALPAMDAGR